MMETNAQMPVVKHRRQLDGALFQLTHGFALAMQGVANLLAPAPDYETPSAAPAQDPPHDTRPEAEGIFNPAFVDVPADVKERARESRRVVPIEDVRGAWFGCDWGHMAYVPLVGGEATLVRKGDFLPGGAAAPGHGSGGLPRQRELRVPGVRVPRRGGGGGRAVGQQRDRVRLRRPPPVLPDAGVVSGRRRLAPRRGGGVGSRRRARWSRTWMSRATTRARRGSPS